MAETLPEGSICMIFPDGNESNPEPSDPKIEIIKSIGGLTLEELEKVTARAETDVEGVGTALALFANLDSDQYLNHDIFFNINSKIIRSIQRIANDLSRYEMEMQLSLDNLTAEAWGRSNDPIIPITRAVDSLSCRERLPTYEAFHIGYKKNEDGRESTFWYTLSDVCQVVKKGTPLQLVHKPTDKTIYEFIWEAPPLKASTA